MNLPRKERKYKANEKDLDSFLKLKLQQWASARARLWEADVPLLLKGMHEFALKTRFVGFTSALTELAGDMAESARGVHLMQLIADAVCQGIDQSDGGILKKSLQETLYLCSGITLELVQPEFGKRFENFLALSGSKALIRLFLSLHLSNLIFRDLYDFLAASAPEELQSRMEEIEEMCEKAAASAVGPLTDWFEPDQLVVSTLHAELNAKILRVLNQRVAFRCGA